MIAHPATRGPGEERVGVQRRPRGGRGLIWLAIALGVLLVAASARAVVTERWGAQSTADHAGAPRDASPRQDQPTWTHDGADLLLGNSNGGEFWALLYFDVSDLAPTTVVRSARLHLAVFSHNEANATWAPIHELLDPAARGPWVEAETTYNERRAGVAWTTSGAGNLATALGDELDRAFLGSLPQWQTTAIDWDVTTAVRHWVASAASNSGLALPYPPGVLFSIPASENADAALRPYLEITYEAANPSRPAQPTAVAAVHRSGQTFVTWNEIAGGNPETLYRVYRHDAPITAQNLDAAALLTEVAPGSSYYRHEDVGCSNGSGCSPIGQSRYVIADDAGPLPAGVGLWVHTVHETAPLAAHYAVTAAVEGNENRDDFLANFAGPIAESQATPRPVRVWSNDTDTGWVYTQFMDAATWNAALEGTAYNFYVGVPASYAGSGGARYPLLAQLHAYTGTYRLPSNPGAGGSDWEWPCVWVAPDDRGNTWWFGFGANAGRRDQPLAGAPIVNYTQQRLDAIFDFVRAELRVDENRMYLWGGSMGGSGTVSYGLRRGDLFAAIYAESAMTDFATAGAAGGTAWEEGGVTALWGTVAQDLPTNLGPSVWTLYDLQSWVASDTGTELPFLADHHGQADDVIDWETQGLPWTGRLEAGRQGYVGVFDNAGHGWTGFVADSPMFTLTQFLFRRDEVYLGFAGASNSNDPAATTGCRNCRLEWSASWHDFAGPPVDGSASFAVVVRTTDGGSATVDITPHRLQQFHPDPGSVLLWENRTLDGALVQSGNATVDAAGRFTVGGFAVTGAGNRSSVVVGTPARLFADGFELATTAGWSRRQP